MEKSESLIVYEHLHMLCTYRGGRVTSRQHTSGDFIKVMSDPGYAVITADREAADARGAAHIIVIQFAANYPFDNVHKFDMQLSRIIAANMAPDVANDVIIVTNAPLRLPIEKVVMAPRAQPNVMVEHHCASMFLIVVPEHSCVPRHTIVPLAEIEKMKTIMHMSPNSFPRLIAGSSHPDPMAVWLGLRPHMVVRIDRPSETVGNEVTYRICA